eukprot:9693110-Prorocentrum_lima.AAC.1
MSPPGTLLHSTSPTHTHTSIPFHPNDEPGHPSMPPPVPRTKTGRGEVVGHNGSRGTNRVV